MKSIYRFYKERLIEISGKNRSLYLKNFNKKNGYDLGRLFFHMPEQFEEFFELLWKGKSLPFRLICKENRDAILKANNIDSKYPEKSFEVDKDKQKYDRQKREFAKKVYAQEVQNLKALKREIEEIEKETGRYELFLCYPFVYGSARDHIFKAPLLMFPIVIDVIDDNNVNIALKHGDKIQLNKALMLAMADSYHLNLQDLDMEFDSLSAKFETIDDLLKYLKGFGVKLSHEPRKNVFAFSRYGEPNEGDRIEIKNLCLLSRCSLANSIYADYSALEKKHFSNAAIDELLNIKTHKNKAVKPQNLYLINNVDYAQEQVVRKVNESGNVVIYGPPGTGKSQTIVNVIADAVCKGKKVLVVSQKRAALEVVFNRLASLNNKAMFLIDAEKERRLFYDRCFSSHNQAMQTFADADLHKQFEDVTKRLDVEINNLNTISNCLNEKTPFGISLQEMYYNSYKIGKRSSEYSIYKELIKDKKIMALNYSQFENALSVLKEQNKAEIYYNFVENKKKNPFIDHLKDDLSVHIVAEAQTKLKNLYASRQTLFDVAKYKYSRQILTYFTNVKHSENLKPLIKMIAKFEYPQADKLLRTSYVVFPMYPFAKTNMLKKEKLIESDFNETVKAIDEYIKDYEFLKNVLTENGYLMALDGILNGNNNNLKLLLWAVENYIELRDTNSILKNLDENQKLVLNFAYKKATTYSKYIEILQQMLPLRIYHEIVIHEEKQQHILSTIVDFDNIRSRIVSLKHQQNAISRAIAEQSFIEDYKKLINGSTESKDYIYQISKKQNYWPIRKTIDVYSEYLFKLFPCWLLSPENVSTILPLKKDMFDVVLFDEASQVFIENTIPSIFRGKRIVVAGDAKQLRPTTTFMKRYMGANIEEDSDYSKQAALEVESLLDLAVSRFNSANITYHYRSKNQELIDFSNKAFYSGSLQIAPNVFKDAKNKPIERILVDGKWQDRKNIVEAKEVVSLLKNILKTRKNNQTIGVITFNSEQESCIEDLLDEECFKDADFRNAILKERNRVDNGEDVSLFVKNLENVQGDERDIIIFSIGYAKNEFGKVNSIFGSLSNEGGENRLNVAITRAKEKIYVVTSIEPEELKVESSKYVGPKLLKSYLAYTRAVSNGNLEEVQTILNSLQDSSVMQTQKLCVVKPIEEQIAKKLNKLGYKTEINIGNSNSKISVAVYDKRKDRFVLGIETDQTVINSSSSALERDVFRNQFLQSRGWKVHRVWSRDWWHNSNQVINTIVKEIEKQTNILHPKKDIKKPIKK